MKRSLTALDITAISYEMNQLSGSYIDKIYQLSPSELLIRINNTKTRQKEHLYIQNETLIALTTQSFETPQKPSVFAQTLRKYLLNGRITHVTQHPFDRIIHIIITKKSVYTITIELFKNGNILLLNEDNTILLPLRNQHWAHRIIKPNHPYTPPPAQQNPFALTKDQFTQLLKQSNKDLVRTLAIDLNFGGTYAEELCIRADLQKNTETNKLSPPQIALLYTTMQQLLAPFKTHTYSPQHVYHNDTLIDIIPLPLQTYHQFTLKPIQSFLAGFTPLITPPKKHDTTTKAYQKKKDKLKRQLTQQQKTIQTYQQHIKEKQHHGDLLYLHFHELEPLLNQIQTILKQKEKQDDITKIQHHPLVNTFEPEENTLIVTLTDKKGTKTNISLDFRKTIADNANQAYQQGKKLRSKIQGAQQAVKQTKQKIQTLTKQQIKEQETSPTTSKQHFWFERYRWFISSEGNLIVAGKDAKTNDQVVKKYLTEGDRYAHADVHGAPSCVIKHTDYTGKSLDISDKTLSEACIFAAAYSKAWNQFAEAQSYWVLPEQVSKTPQSGEFVPRGAFIIRGKRNYYQCTLELAIGEIQLDDTKKIMGGPVSAVQTHAEKYVVIKPGVMKKTTAVKKLSTLFNASTEQLQQVLPPVGITITESKGITFEGR